MGSESHLQGALLQQLAALLEVNTTLTELNCVNCSSIYCPPENVQEEGFVAMRRWWAMTKKKEALTKKKEALTTKKEAKAKPNDPCPCGSGKKFKKCCAVAK